MNYFLGNYFGRNGRTVMVDHQITTITVKIRSMNTIDSSVVKRLLQQKYEVLTVAKSGQQIIAQV